MIDLPAQTEDEKDVKVTLQEKVWQAAQDSSPSEDEKPRPRGRSPLNYNNTPPKLARSLNGSQTSLNRK